MRRVLTEWHRGIVMIRDIFPILHFALSKHVTVLLKNNVFSYELFLSLLRIASTTRGE